MSCAEGPPRPRRFPLEIRARRTPDAPALVWRANTSKPPLPPFGKGGGRGFGASAETSCLTFAELELRTRLAALDLRARGLARGERIALLLPAGPAYVIALLALLRAGCVAVPLSTRLPAETVPALLARIGCRRLIAGAPADVPGIEILDPGPFQLPEACAPSASIPLSRSGTGLREIASGEAGELPPFDPGAPATIVFTSGSMGVPKAALHSFGNHRASAAGANRNLPLRPGDRWLLSLPLWHVGGLAVVFRCIQGGAAIALARGDEPLAEAVPALGVTHVSLVATQLRRLLGEPGGRAVLPSLKAVLLGGGPLPEPLIADAAALGARLVTSYGSTEACSQATATRPGDPPEALRTAGRPLPLREVAVDESGGILVRGRTLFLGYLEGDEVRSVRDEDGWFHTGDLGRVDEAGRLIVEGRRDNMFVSGGENIHPEEIERELGDFPGVLEALVVPVPDPEFGARPAAFLRTAGGELPEPAAIGAFLRRRVAGFKVPVRYLAWPRLETGLKPDRRAFAALLRRPDAAAGEE